MAKQPIHVVVPVTLDPTDPSVPIALTIEVQNFPLGNSPETSISLLDALGRLRKFEEIQAEYAQKALRTFGTATRVEKLSGVTRQTIAKWAQS